MALVKNTLRGLTIPQKLDKLAVITGKLQGNADFPTPTPTLVALQANIDALQTAFLDVSAARETARLKGDVQDAADTAFDNAVSTLASYVQTASHGAAEKIVSSGFDVRDERHPLGVPDAPTDLSLTRGDQSGETDGHFHSVKGARSYEIRYSLGQAPANLSVDEFGDGWLDGKTVFRSKFELKGLTPGQRIWVQVRAQGTAGESAWSQPATAIIG